MPVHHPLPRRAAHLTALALSVLLVPLTACSGTLGGSGTPTTTDPPLAAQEMCDLGKDVFQDIDELDRRKADYLDTVKTQIKRLAPRAPKEIYEDVRVWVAFVDSVSEPAQLASLPADLKVSTGRIDAWFQQNCGRPLIGQ